MMIILMIRTENKGWLCYCHMLLVSKKQKMEHATLKIRVGQKYTGSVLQASDSLLFVDLLHFGSANARTTTHLYFIV